MPEITIPIDGKQIRFKATGGTGYRYKAQFGREYIADAVTLQEFSDTRQEIKKQVNGKTEITVTYDYTKLSLEMLYNMLWVLAKTADDSIPAPQAWLDSFETFPVMDIFAKVKPIMNQNMKIDAKNE